MFDSPIDLIIQHDIWDEALLGEEYAYAVERVLTVKERFVLEARVEGKSWTYIAKILKISRPTARRYKSDIISKLQHNMSKRVDNYPYFHYKIKGRA